VTSPDLVNELLFTDSPRYALEYMLSMQCVDKTILRAKEQLQIGIGCACAHPETSDEQNWVCYIGIAKNVRARDVTEFVPEY
jgi:hypothetical protein